MFVVLWISLRKRSNAKKIDFFYFPKIIWKEKALSFPRLLKLKDYQKIANDFEEFPLKDNEDLLSPNYNKSTIEKTTRGFSQISKNILHKVGLDIEELSVSHFKKIIEYNTNIRESKGLNQPHVLLDRLQSDEKFYIWGDLHGAFHSLMRTLKDLEKNNVINNNLQIMNSRHFLVFNGNGIGRSPYNLETLSLIITLMLKNPENVIYLKGLHEEKRYWLNLGLRDELEILARGLSSEKTPLESLISRFFATLPETLYLGEISQGPGKI